MTDKKTIFEHVPRGDVFDLLTNMFDNQVYLASGLDIDDSNSEDFETNITVDYSIDGILYTYTADDACVISSECDQFDVDADAGVVLADDYECVYLLLIDKSGNLDYRRSTPLAILSTTDHVVPDFDRELWVAFGAIKVKNETGSTFTFGTTGLDTGSVTDTYYDLNNPMPGQECFGSPA